MIETYLPTSKTVSWTQAFYLCEMHMPQNVRVNPQYSITDPGGTLSCVSSFQTMSQTQYSRFAKHVAKHTCQISKQCHKPGNLFLQNMYQSKCTCQISKLCPGPNILSLQNMFAQRTHRFLKQCHGPSAPCLQNMQSSVKTMSWTKHSIFRNAKNPLLHLCRMRMHQNVRAEQCSWDQGCACSQRCYQRCPCYSFMYNVEHEIAGFGNHMENRSRSDRLRCKTISDRIGRPTSEKKMFVRFCELHVFKFSAPIHGKLLIVAVNADCEMVWCNDSVPFQGVQEVLAAHGGRVGTCGCCR